MIETRNRLTGDPRPIILQEISGGTGPRITVDTPLGAQSSPQTQSDNKKDKECKKRKCLPCTPPAGTFMYEIAPGSSRTRGAHVGVDHVKYWKMNQIPYSKGNPKSCECHWNFDRAQNNTLTPFSGAIPGGPPKIISGPSLGGGVAPL